MEKISAGVFTSGQEGKLQNFSDRYSYHNQEGEKTDDHRKVRHRGLFDLLWKGQRKVKEWKQKAKVRKGCI